MDWSDAHVDGNHIVTHVSSFSPPAIKVYYADGTFYKSIPLSNDAIKLDSLEISDGRVYYTEYDSSQPRYLRNETVYEFDLNVGEKRIIYTTSQPQQTITKIAADGDHVVLLSKGGSHDLILHTLSTGTNQIIFTSESMIYGLAIDGDRIMWGCERTDGEPGREIHVYTISMNEDYIIPESKSAGTWGYGDISGVRVVWAKAAEEPDTSLGYLRLMTAGGDIRLTDLTTGNTISLEILDAPSFPYISGDTVVYVKEPETSSNTGIIRVYNIDTGKFIDVASEVAGISDFDKELILWHRYSPRSDWISSISGKIPTVISPTPQGVTQISGAGPQNTPQGSPVDPVVIISAFMVGITARILLKKKY